MKWYLEALRRYLDFKSRSTRTEFWMFTLFNLLFYIAAAILDITLGLWDQEFGVCLFTGLYCVFILLPNVSVAVRRLHDVGLTGWLYLLVFVPIAGPFIILGIACVAGKPGTNKYGPNPKEAQQEEDEGSISV